MKGPMRQTDETVCQFGNTVPNPDNLAYRK